MKQYIGVLKGIVSLMSNIDANLANKVLISEHLNYLPNANLPNANLPNANLPNANSPESDEDDNPDEADKADESINTLRTSKLVFP